MKLYQLYIYLDSNTYYFSTDEKRQEFKEKYAKMFDVEFGEFNYDEVEVDPDFEKMFVR